MGKDALLVTVLAWAIAGDCVPVTINAAPKTMSSDSILITRFISLLFSFKGGSELGFCMMA